uniref:Cilia- and flagella-associated protein 69 ARM repeats domain-containing protein n=1 Tax=Pyxicephalus adspersus TaxID=30357 RepID=A0AAV3AT40_PYXAD|nr:TPA: hypothetical protein GDO54_012751 [Pyxicephalus adspersus]
MPAAQGVAAAPLMGIPRPDNGKKSAGRPVVKLVVTDTELGESEAVPSKPIDMNRVLNLFEDPFSRDLVERHVRILKKVAKTYCNGILLKDLPQIVKILNICATRAGDHTEYIDPMCDIVKLCGLPFLKERMSDEATYAQVVADSFSQLGCLMRVPSSQLRIQICKSIANFYNPEMSKQQTEGFQPTSLAYKIKMAEVGGMAETLVLSLTLLENHLQEKIALLKVLQLFSNSIENCKLMAKAQAACRICSRLNDPDPSGQVLFRSSEILWNLLENGPKEEIINQLSNIECIYALKDSFVRLLTNGYRHYDRQLRNDLLVITTLIAENNCSPLVESGFAKQLILFATFSEVKSHNPLVKNLKLLHKHEDFEMKKLLLNMMVVLAKDLSAVQLLCDGKAVLALFNYVKASEKPGIHDWPAARFEDLQLHAIATLSTVAPLLVEDYMTCQGNTRILLFLEWCSSQGILKKSLAGSGKNDNFILLEIQSDILFILSSLCENDTHRKELFGSEGVDILIQLLKMEPSKIYSGLGHNKLLFCTLDAVWSCIIGCFTSEDYFLEKEGMFIILDLLALNLKNMNNLLLGILVEFCDNPKTIPHILTWRGKNNDTVPKHLVRLWKQEEEELGVRRDSYGRIIDAERPLVGQFQDEQEVVPMPANCFSVAIMEVAENVRAKIYSVFCRLGFENLPGLSALDYVTLSVISRYLDFKIKANHKQSEMVMKTWDKFLARTSNYEALRKAKRLQEKSIDSSRQKARPQNSTLHSTHITNLNTTVACGRVVTVERTPSKLIGGPLADTDLAIKRVPIRGGALQKTKSVRLLN